MVGIVVGVFFFGFLLGVVFMALLAVSKGGGPARSRREADGLPGRVIWHLTPRGWLSESEAVSLREDKGIPPDRVFSCAMETIHGLGHLSGAAVEIWRCSDAAKVRELFDRFGKTPSTGALYPDLFAGDSRISTSRHT